MHWASVAGLWPVHFFCLLIVGLLIWGAIYWFNTRGRRMHPFPSGTPHHEPDALEILHQRYARGEIDATTFEQMRERLSASERPRS